MNLGKAQHAHLLRCIPISVQRQAIEFLEGRMIDTNIILSRIARDDVHWTVIVEVLSDLEAMGSLDAEGRPWARVVAQQTQQSLNQLRKMQRTLSILRELAVGHNNINVTHVIETVPFSHAEVLARIVKADEKRGCDLIKKYLTATRTPTYRELLKQFHDIRDSTPHTSSVAAGQRAARMFENTCFEMLMSSSASILPTDFGDRGAKPIRWSGGLQYASPDLILGFRTENGELIADGVDCISAYGEISQDETAKRMARTATESTFFRFFWLLIAPWSPFSLIHSMRDELELANVGLIMIDPENKTVERKVAPGGRPEPDRRLKAAPSLRWLLRKV
jgi:hypothetical protein